MSVILCPTRGGQSSIPNQQRAVALAKERQAQLIFLYVTNVHFLDRISSPVLVDISRELDEMGEFLLAVAQERAMEEGVTADIIVRRGAFQENLTEVIAERNVDVVVIGRSTRGTGITSGDFVANIAQLLNEMGVELIVVDEGEIVEAYRPGQASSGSAADT